MEGERTENDPIYNTGSHFRLTVNAEKKVDVDECERTQHTSIMSRRTGISAIR